MTAADVPAVAAAQARAFLDDPLQVWTLPDRRRRLGVLERMFVLALPVILLRHDECYTLDGGASAALWLPPGTWSEPLPAEAMRALAELPQLLGTAALDRQRAANDAMAAVHPHEPHWYLQGLGTDPPMRRRGLASAALGPVLDRCDADGTAAYLESTRPENVAFYERHGFVVTGTIAIAGGGPTLTAMWRPPR